MEQTQTNQQQEIANTQATTETKPNDWLKQEAESLGTQREYDELPSMQFVENEIVEFDVDFLNAFEKWDDTVNKVKKAIIPVTHENTKKNLWLNVKNPLYGEIVRAGQEGKKHFKILQTGNKATTKYTIVKN